MHVNFHVLVHSHVHATVLTYIHTSVHTLTHTPPHTHTQYSPREMERAREEERTVDEDEFLPPASMDQLEEYLDMLYTV